MTKPIFDVAKWKRETYRQLLYPGGTIPKFEYKAPPLYYGSADGDTEADDTVVEIEDSE